MTVTQDDSSLILRVAEALFDYDQLDFAFDDIPEVREKFIQRAQVAWSLMAIDFFEGSQVLAEQSFAKHREDAERPLLKRIEALEAESARLRDALEKVVGACRNARMVPKPGCGAGGMTIEANVRASVYNGVNAWSIEEAQEILDMSAWPAKN